LYFAEKPHPVLFQHDEMRSLTDNDKALVGTRRKSAKNRECTLRGVEPVPLGRNDQCGNFDPVWFIKWLTCLAGLAGGSVLLAAELSKPVADKQGRLRTP
jgi:hypothetical protein